ncbi:PREDICTED: 28S ribosomal protein S34, mitochondrial [Nicrophorus vespilloides]|uniref:28S ribosomal protein S34, mitochondrial n=1 Tax=Nicrophorus vespilloides TaxID=110193 RepID=A0ABM1MU24_NICVS|nr:PREDICTED: 28S ribosomal protein S34, mitochondrial [Nicrophorus vespilloides]
MPYKYIGRKTDFRGKTLWEILGNLKNFGVGRIVTRSIQERYPEPSFMKIVKVEALPNPAEAGPDNLRKVRVFVEKTFRGVKQPKLIALESTSYKADYQLVPKREEEAYLKLQSVSAAVRVLPKYMALPPLMREVEMQEMNAKGKEFVEPKIEVVYKKNNSNYKISEEMILAYGLGKPVTPSLYKDVEL